jgi:hypothetical protein
VLCRCGALTIAELSIMGRPSIAPCHRRSPDSECTCTDRLWRSHIITPE